MNKADELFVTTNQETMTTSEMSEAIDLDESKIKQFLQSSKKVSPILKSARIKVGDQVIGAQLSKGLADLDPIPRKTLEESNRPHIYKSKKKRE